MVLFIQIWDFPVSLNELGLAWRTSLKVPFVPQKCSKLSLQNIYIYPATKVLPENLKFATPLPATAMQFCPYPKSGRPHFLFAKAHWASSLLARYCSPDEHALFSTNCFFPWFMVLCLYYLVSCTLSTHMKDTKSKFDIYNIL